VDQVRAIVDTDMVDSDISEIIDEVSAEMDLVLPTSSLSSTILQAICRRKAALDVFLKDPNASSAGEYREDRGQAIENLRRRIRELELAADGGLTFVVAYENLTDELETS